MHFSILQNKQTLKKKKSRLSPTTFLEPVESSISHYGFSLRRCLQAFKISNEHKVLINFAKILTHLTFLA